MISTQETTTLQTSPSNPEVLTEQGNLEAMADKKVSEILNELHEAVASDLLFKIKSGEAKAADLSVAAKFLKDNGIEAIPTNNSTLVQLLEEMPFDEDDLIQTN